MRTFAIGLTLFLASLTPSTAHAQSSHVASQAAIDHALQQQVDSTQAQRTRVLQLLERADVRAIADRMGLDLRRAETAVSTLEGQQLAEVDAQAQRVEGALAGGRSVTIDTTLIIIGLLLLIVLILALK